MRLTLARHSNSAFAVIRLRRDAAFCAGVAGLALLAAVAGCTKIEPGQPPPPAADVAATDAWLGRWAGPEGTYLEISGGGGRYELTVANLDGPRSFQGQAQGDNIVFQRDGQPEIVRATDGVGTGMKWLADQSNCVVINPGEGFCRP